MIVRKDRTEMTPQVTPLGGHRLTPVYKLKHLFLPFGPLPGSLLLKHTSIQVSLKRGQILGKTATPFPHVVLCKQEPTAPSYLQGLAEAL